MEIGRVVGIYWSATGNTEKVTNCLAEELAAAFKCRKELIRFTLPEDRLNVLNLEPGDLAVVGSPVYAGKLPNKMLPDFRDKLRGNGTLAVGIVTFGNRSFDNGLAELCAVLTAVSGQWPGEPLPRVTPLRIAWPPAVRMKKICRR